MYSIPCKCGEEYVGETGRTLQSTKLMTEHKTAVKKNDSNNTLAVHASNTHHNISGKRQKYSPEKEKGIGLRGR